MMNTGNWTREGGQCDVNFRDLYDTYLDLAARHRQDGAPLDIMLGGFYYGLKDSKHWMSPYNRFSGQENVCTRPVCQSCRVHPYIMADGTLLPCIPLTGTDIERNMPNLAATTFADALFRSEYFNLIDTRLERLYEENADCRTCEHRFKCGGGCRAAALTDTGNYFGNDPDSCFFFKNGYEERLALRLEDKPATPLEIAQARMRIAAEIAD